MSIVDQATGTYKCDGCGKTIDVYDVFLWGDPMSCSEYCFDCHTDMCKERLRNIESVDRLVVSSLGLCSPSSEPEKSVATRVQEMFNQVSGVAGYTLTCKDCGNLFTSSFGLTVRCKSCQEKTVNTWHTWTSDSTYTTTIPSEFGASAVRDNGPYEVEMKQRIGREQMKDGVLGPADLTKLATRIMGHKDMLDICCNDENSIQCKDCPILDFGASDDCSDSLRKEWAREYLKRRTHCYCCGQQLPKKRRFKTVEELVASGYDKLTFEQNKITVEHRGGYFARYTRIEAEDIVGEGPWWGIFAVDEN